VRAPASAGVPPVFLPPAKQRSKRARRSSASGTDCDETGQSGGVVLAAAGKLAPRASACLSDVPMSFAGSGGSAFRVRRSSRVRKTCMGALAEEQSFVMLVLCVPWTAAVMAKSCAGAADAVPVSVVCLAAHE